jgi:hypothetical protein
MRSVANTNANGEHQNFSMDPMAVHLDSRHVEHKDLQRTNLNSLLDPDFLAVREPAIEPAIKIRMTNRQKLTATPLSVTRLSSVDGRWNINSSGCVT